MLFFVLMHDRAARRLGRGRCRGFTLTELMAVVAIIGVLATLGIAALRRNSRQSDVSGAIVVVKAIAAAEEQYRAINQVYLNVSTPNTWYPQNILPANSKSGFWKAAGDGGSVDSETARWRQLNPDIRQTVQFVFMANAGLPSDPIPQPPAGTLAAPTTSIEPWYLIQAKADADADNVLCIVAAASWTPEVFTANDGE
jgi:prepilin-type N-terminal cleavage/methylation domain-containing protein